ncbi:MAG TPA: DUF1990 domain-containing protein [Jatrophihabitans sp.]|nr:DUF1990 domain-containing protein [Jatrophihabitans sp.]
MARLRFIPLDGSFEKMLAQARADQPTYPGGLDPRPGFETFVRTIRLARGEESFRAAGETILGWGMQRGAGLRVQPEVPRATVGSTVVLGIGVAGVYLAFPCRVNEVYAEPTRLGFSYLTLPGHPECGMERFLVELSPDGAVQASVAAISRPANLLVTLAGPLARTAQRRAADRYLAAL